MNYKFSSHSILPPTALRSALSSLYKTSDRFQLGQLADAQETLEAVLDTIHRSAIGAGPNQEIEWYEFKISLLSLFFHYSFLGALIAVSLLVCPTRFSD